MDETAYKALFEQYMPALKRFAFSIIRSNIQAEDIASGVMIQLWRNRSSISSIQDIKTYLFIATRNACINHLKRDKGRKHRSLDDIDVEISIEIADPEKLLISGEMKKKMEQAIRDLPARCKMVFKLVKEEGLSYKEVADILGISVKTVDAQLVTALRKITASVKPVYYRS
jgi:RNA polymerase sigma-70 factor (ECF subfamily)